MEELSKLGLKEGDIVVLKVDDCLSRAWADDLKMRLGNALPTGVSTLVLGRGQSLEVIRPEEPEPVVSLQGPYGWYGRYVDGEWMTIRADCKVCRRMFTTVETQVECPYCGAPEDVIEYWKNTTRVA